MDFPDFSRAIFFYLGKLLWPANLIFSYPRWNISAGNSVNYAWPIALACLLIAGWLAFGFARSTVLAPQAVTLTLIAVSHGPPQTVMRDRTVQSASLAHE